jgi:hypothetical protein
VDYFWISVISRAILISRSRVTFDLRGLGGARCEPAKPYERTPSS